MLNKIDFLFFYKNTLRYLLVNKSNLLTNTFQIQNLNKFVIYIYIKNCEKFNQSEYYNYFYLFRFFFGCRAFFFKYRTFFSLGVWSYNFNIQYIFNKKYIFDNLYFLLNDFFPFMFVKNLRYKFIRNNKFYLNFITFNDMYLFNEKKTNLGLFFLKQPLFLRYNTNCSTLDFSKLLFFNLKIKYFF